MDNNNCTCCGRWYDCCICKIGPALYYRGECKNCHPVSSQVGAEIWSKAVEMLIEFVPQEEVEDFLEEHGAKMHWRNPKPDFVVENM